MTISWSEDFQKDDKLEVLKTNIRMLPFSIAARSRACGSTRISDWSDASPTAGMFGRIVRSVTATAHRASLKRLRYWSTATCLGLRTKWLAPRNKMRSLTNLKNCLVRLIQFFEKSELASDWRVLLQLQFCLLIFDFMLFDLLLAITKLIELIHQSPLPSPPLPSLIVSFWQLTQTYPQHRPFGVTVWPPQHISVDGL